MSIRFYLFSIFSFALLSSCGSKKEDCVFDVEYKGAYFTNSFKYKDVKKEADSTTEIPLYDDEMDEIKLGSFTFELYKDGKFIFANKKISRAAFKSIQNLNFDVTINCFSGRKSSDLNLFKIDYVGEKILNLNAKPSKVSGSLL
jgi:hypothetical protein